MRHLRNRWKELTQHKLNSTAIMIPSTDSTLKQRKRMKAELRNNYKSQIRNSSRILSNLIENKPRMLISNLILADHLSDWKNTTTIMLREAERSIVSLPLIKALKVHHNILLKKTPQRRLSMLDLIKNCPRCRLNRLVYLSINQVFLMEVACLRMQLQRISLNISTLLPSMMIMNVLK